MSKILFLSNIFQNNIPKSNTLYNGQNYEVGYDVITNKLKINNPPNHLMRKNIFFINTDQNIMAKLNGKLNLTELDVDVVQNTGYGNWFYKDISQFGGYPSVHIPNVPQNKKKYKIFINIFNK